jgi:hypothetical protein
MFKRFVSGTAALGLLTALVVFGPLPASAAGTPSGQRMFGSATFDTASGHFVGGGGSIEPAYDDATGTLVYIQTPNGPPVHPATHIDPATGMPRNVAPIYLPVYPTGSGIDPASLNCAHVPADNCADHGPGVADAVAGIEPSVYGAGVVGHDHLLGIAKTGGDFNILWEPVLILFTSVQASMTRITTLAQIKAAEAANPPQVFEVALPQLTFHCSVVSAAAYNGAVPAPVVPSP